MPDTRPLALVNARLVDPEAPREIFGGALIVDGFIVGVGPKVSAADLPPEASVIDFLILFVFFFVFARLHPASPKERPSTATLDPAA